MCDNCPEVVTLSYSPTSDVNSVGSPHAPRLAVIVNQSIRVFSESSISQTLDPPPKKKLLTSRLYPSPEDAAIQKTLAVQSKESEVK